MEKEDFSDDDHLDICDARGLGHRGINSCPASEAGEGALADGHTNTEIRCTCSLCHLQRVFRCDSRSSQEQHACQCVDMGLPWMDGIKTSPVMNQIVLTKVSIAYMEHRDLQT